MRNQKDSEILYFQSKLSEVTYNSNRFKVMIGEDRFLFGVISANDNEAPFGRYMIL